MDVRIIGVNGIWNKKFGKSSFTDRMLTGMRLKGYRNTVDVNIDHLTWLEAYQQEELEQRARCVLEVHQPGDNVIAHSAGCLVTNIAMHMGARFGVVFFFAAAASPTIQFPPDGMHVLYNVHSPSDLTLLLGQITPLHPFGALGRTGYKGDDTRVINVLRESMRHNTYAIEPEHYEDNVNFMDQKLREYYGTEERFACG